MLADFLAGRLGGPADVSLAARVCRVVVAGDSVTAADKTLAREKYVCVSVCVSVSE